MKMISGKVFIFGDNIDTDQIYPGRYLELTDHREIAKHAMEGVDPDFVKKVEEGDIIVAGKNFGCGSSREHAVICLKKAGVGAVLAKSFARIFYRNALNLGLPVIEISVNEFKAGDRITIDLERGEICKAGNKKFYFKPLPVNLLNIIKEGGVINYYRNKNKQK